MDDNKQFDADIDFNSAVASALKRVAFDESKQRERVLTHAFDYVKDTMNFLESALYASWYANNYPDGLTRHRDVIWIYFRENSARRDLGEETFNRLRAEGPLFSKEDA